MNYEFALDKKALISLIAGSVVIAVLLFLAGWILGRQWTVVASAEAASITTNDERAALPKEPVLHDDATAPNSDTRKIAKPNVTAPKEPADIAGQAQASAAASQLPAKPAVDVRVIETTPDDPAAEADAEAAIEPEYVTVQVGIFLNQNEASNLLQQVEKKGYAPSFFSGRDAEARQWYAVRIGSYSDRQQAVSAAANFTRQEKIKAVVRPMGSL